MIYFPPAKINLGLKVLEKQEDGFHNIESIFLPTQLCDVLEVHKLANGNNGELKLECSGIEIVGDIQNNTVVRAHQLLDEQFELPALEVKLHKLIPTGSGLEWSTTRVLKESQFNVITGSDYEGLFGMLMLDRFTTFGRGINEAFDEFDQHKKQYPELTIDEKFLLFIPLPTYFFVSPKKPELRNRIELGLNKLIKTGEFEKIFQKEFGALIKKANLAKRTIFKIPNPNLTPEDPVNIKEYWFNPKNSQ